MIKKLKTWWQNYLDRTAPVPEQPRRAAMAPSFFGPAADRPTAVMPHFQPARNTAPLVLRELRQEVAVEQEVARAYEAQLGPMASAMLRDLDETFAGMLSERQRQRTWRTVMYDRRTERNQVRVLVDVEHLWRDDVPEEERAELVKSGILARALHASDPDAPTGLIPVMAGPSYEVSEEDTA